MPRQEEDVALAALCWRWRELFGEIATVRNSRIHGVHFWEQGRRREGSWEMNIGKRSSLPRLECFTGHWVVGFTRAAYHPTEERSIPHTAASEPQLYIYNYNYSNITIYLYLYMYTWKSVTALARHTEEKYWRCCSMQVVALTEVLWRVSTTRKGTTRFWELRCHCPNTAVGNEHIGLSRVNEGRWGQATFRPRWRQKKTGNSQKK